MKGGLKSTVARPNVGPLITRNLPFLRDVYGSRRSKPTVRQLIGRASDEQLLCFVEICLNILRGRLPLRKRHIAPAVRACTHHSSAGPGPVCQVSTSLADVHPAGCRHWGCRHCGQRVGAPGGRCAHKEGKGGIT